MKTHSIILSALLFIGLLTPTLGRTEVKSLLELSIQKTRRAALLTQIESWGQKLLWSDEQIAAAKTNPTRYRKLIRQIQSLGLLENYASELYQWIDQLPLPLEMIERIKNSRSTLNIAAGTNHSLILAGNNQLFGFGNNEDGQLGSAQYDFERVPTLVQNILLVSEEKLVTLATGDQHTLALTNAGNVFTFGSNEFGQLGQKELGNYPQATRLDPVQLNEEEKVIQISTADLHTLFLTDQNRVFSFGSKYHGQLEHGEFVAQPELLKTVPLHPSEKIIRISAKGFHSLLLSNEGRVFSFGHGSFGQLGHGTEHSLDLPHEIQGFQLSEQETVVNIFAGPTQSFALTSMGRVFCFGETVYGHTGLETQDNILAPQWAPALSFEKNEKVIQIAVGQSHSLFLTNLGRVYALGQGDEGQIGKGEIEAVTVPTLIDSLPLHQDESVSQVVAGDYHSLLSTNHNRVFSFGYNDRGQLGLGHIENERTPKEILLLDWWNNPSLDYFPR
jgi:alpha-tubulin suppressor-like RCC1 family protein